MVRERFAKYILYPFKLILNCIGKCGSLDPTDSGSSVTDTIFVMLSQSRLTVEPCGRCINTVYWSKFNLHANNTDTYTIYNTFITQCVLNFYQKHNIIRGTLSITGPQANMGPCIHLQYISKLNCTVYSLFPEMAV